MALSSYTIPPKTGNEEFDNFILEFFNQAYGLGDDVSGSLDGDNIEGGTGSPYDRDNHTGSQLAATISDFGTAFGTEHDGISGGHSSLKQGADPSDSATSAVSVTSADAGASYGAGEQALINELKADVNTLVADVNIGISKLNTLLANLRTAGVIV